MEVEGVVVVDADEGGEGEGVGAEEEEGWGGGWGVGNVGPALCKEAERREGRTRDPPPSSPNRSDSTLSTLMLPPLSVLAMLLMEDRLLMLLTDAPLDALDATLGTDEEGTNDAGEGEVTTVPTPLPLGFASSAPCPRFLVSASALLLVPDPAPPPPPPFSDPSTRTTI